MRYPCDLCDYQATQRGRLRVYMLENIAEFSFLVKSVHLVFFLAKLNYVIILDQFMKTILTIAISVTTRRDNLQKCKLTWRVTQTFVMSVILLECLESC